MTHKQKRWDYLGSAILVLAATSIAAVLSYFTKIESVSAVYMLPVVISAVRFGTRPAMLTAVMCAGTTSLFYPPVFSIKVVQTWQIVDLVVSLLVAVTIGRLAAQTRADMLAARERERQVKRLYDLGSAMVAASDAETIFRIVADHMSEALSRPVAVYARDRNGRVNAVPGEHAADVDPTLLIPAIERVIRAAPLPVDERAELVRLPNGETWLLFPLGEAAQADAVLAVGFGRDTVAPLTDVIENARFILDEGSRSLEQLGLTRAIEERDMRRRTDELRDILIESVSHELRTPIAGIMGSAGVLAAAPALASEPRLVELACSIESEADRLDTKIQNLLDVTRIRSGALLPRFQVIDPIDVVNAALEAAADRLSEHRVSRDYGSDLPLVRVDAVLVEQALINILENAGKFSPPGSVIRVMVEVMQNELNITVSDSGVGFDPSQHERIFERFYRGVRHADLAGGSGLGLTIAQVFVEANGGRISATSEGNGEGSRLSVTLPLLTQASALEGFEDE